jgi:hypothetical protein
MTQATNGKMILAEFSHAMTWVQERSVFLGVVALGITTWLWMDFSVVYGIGVGVFSGGVLGAFPSLLICAVLLSLILTLILVMPALVLMVQVGPKRPQLLQLDRERAGSQNGNPHRIPWRSYGRWALCSAIQAACLALTIFVPASTQMSNLGELVLSVACIALALSLPTLLFYRLVGGEQSFDFRSTVAGSVMVQIQLTMLGILGVISFVPDLEGKLPGREAALFIAVSALVGAAEAAVQVFLIGQLRILVTGKRVVIRSIVATQGLLILTAVIPQVGAGLIYTPVRIMGMNGMKCAVLAVSPKASEPLPEALVATGKKRTLELSFITPAIEGTRFVRIKEHEGLGTFAIPTASVGQPEPCTPTTRGGRAESEKG